MKLLFITDNFPPEVNAAATRVYERARYWVKWGHKVTVITCAPNFPQGKLYKGYSNDLRFCEIIDGIRVVRVKTFISENDGFLCRILDFASFMVSAVFISLFERKPDLVIATSPQFFTAIAGYFISKFKKVPYIFELSDLWPETVRAVGVLKKSIVLDIFEFIELYLYRNSSAVVALTKSFKENLISRGIKKDKIFVIRNGVDLTIYSPNNINSNNTKRILGLNNEFTIGYIGTHGVCQGLINVLKASELLKNEYNLKFLFVGPGAERKELIKYAEEKKLNSVMFVEPQPKNIMPDIWSICDVALVHLKNDKVFSTVIPSKIFEAMGMGIPILLVAPNGEAECIINDTKSGEFVIAENPQLLANMIIKLYENRKHLKKLAENSAKSAKNHSREKQALDFINVCKYLLNK